MKSNNKKHAPHPSYPNPSIIEALCEIHIIPVRKFSNSEIGELKKELKKDYPKYEEKEIKQYQAAVNNNGIKVHEKSTVKWIFKHRLRNHLIQLTSKSLVVNEVEAYPGWEIFIKDLACAWSSINHVNPVKEVVKIGLRYINSIPRASNKEPLGHWLKRNKYYPDGIIEYGTRFVSRNEFQLSETEKLIVTIAEPEQKPQVCSFIFDIDFITNVKKNIDWEELSQILIKSHDVIWEVFSSSLSKKYIEFLENNKA